MRHEVESSYSLIDIQQSIILVFMMLLALIFSLVKIEQDQQDKNQDSPGDVIVQLFWDMDVTTDIDLWVRTPNDRAVGYSNKAGTYFNLLRDDLGIANDISGFNEEIAYSRGQPDGEYVVNAHSYSSAGHYPVTAKVVVSHMTSTGNVLPVWAGQHIFTGPNQEYTFIRFTIYDKKIQQPFNFVQLPLRSVPR